MDMKFNRFFFGGLLGKISFIFLLLYCSGISFAEENIPDINTILMNSTFKIEGGNKVTGTAFILGRPVSGEKNAHVLVTAAHVLNGIEGESAILVLRRRAGDKYTKLNHILKIRNKKMPLWVSHPNADVAAMYIAVPKEAYLLLASTDLLATDNILIDYEMYPGRELKVLGFPFSLESQDSGFPVLRTGAIASFPITPSRELKTFLMDFDVFGGNSGGPVYFHDPDWHKRRSGAITAAVEVQIIVGLVSKQKIITEKISSMYEENIKRHQVGLAEVIHASIVKETIELLPNVLGKQ